MDDWRMFFDLITTLSKSLSAFQSFGQVTKNARQPIFYLFISLLIECSVWWLDLWT